MGMTVNSTSTPEKIAKKLTQRLFRLGSSPERCERIQFMSARWDGVEKGQGGFNQAGLSQWMADQLSELLATPTPHLAADKRPRSCRNRLMSEGKTYPKSGCDSCSDGGICGCPYERGDL